MKHEFMMQDMMQTMIEMMAMREKPMKGPKAEKNREGELSGNSRKVSAGGFSQKRLMCR
jgi:hypothetical protein